VLLCKIAASIRLQVGEPLFELLSAMGGHKPRHDLGNHSSRSFLCRQTRSFGRSVPVKSASCSPSQLGSCQSRSP
jgi:hypothetical protein